MRAINMSHYRYRNCMRSSWAPGSSSIYIPKTVYKLPTRARHVTTIRRHLRKGCRRFQVRFFDKFNVTTLVSHYRWVSSDASTPQAPEGVIYFHNI